MGCDGVTHLCTGWASRLRFAREWRIHRVFVFHNHQRNHLQNFPSKESYQCWRKRNIIIPYSYKFSRGWNFARIRAQTPKCAKFFTIITRSREVRENKSARKFSKYRFSKFDDFMFIFLTIYDAFYILWVGVRENKSARFSTDRASDFRKSEQLGWQPSTLKSEILLSIFLA